MQTPVPVLTRRRAQPLAHSIVSDLYAPDDRGNAFGWVGFGTIMGGSFGTLYGTNIGSVETIMGIHGWRFMFLSMSVIACVGPPGVPPSPSSLSLLRPSAPLTSGTRPLTSSLACPPRAGWASPP